VKVSDFISGTSPLFGTLHFIYFRKREPKFISGTAFFEQNTDKKVRFFSGTLYFPQKIQKAESTRSTKNRIRYLQYKYTS